ncbi:hypothetical protein V6N13_057226 [Hibiscus sabdariffa]
MVRLADFVRLKEHRSSSSDGRAEDFTAIYGDFQWPSRETSLCTPGLGLSDPFSKSGEKRNGGSKGS